MRPRSVSEKKQKKANGNGCARRGEKETLGRQKSEHGAEAEAEGTAVGVEAPAEVTANVEAPAEAEVGGTVGAVAVAVAVVIANAKHGAVLVAREVVLVAQEEVDPDLVVRVVLAADLGGHAVGLDRDAAPDGGQIGPPLACGTQLRASSSPLLRRRRPTTKCRRLDLFTVAASRPF